MDKLEKQLFALPRARLGRRADLRLRGRLWLARQRARSRSYFLGSWQWRAAATAVMLLVFFVLPAYAYASRSVTIGHLLFPIKQGLEEIELKVHGDPADRARIQSKLAERRLSEAGYLAKQAEAATSSLVASIDEAVRLSAAAAASADKVNEAGQALAAAEAISASKTRQAGKLSEVALAVGLDAEETVVDRVAKAIREVKKTPLPADQAAVPASDEPSSARPDEETAATTSPLRPEFTGTTTSSPPPSTATAEESPFFWRRSAVPPRPFESEADEASSAPAQALLEVKARAEEIKTDLPANEYEPADKNKLIKRIREKIDKAEEALKKNQPEKYGEFLDAADALTENGRFFIRKKTGNKDGTEAGDKAEEQEKFKGGQGDEDEEDKKDGDKNKKGRSDNNGKNRKKQERKDDDED